MSIVLHQFRRHGAIPNLSPFCMKLETYLRMAGLEYTTAEVLIKRRSPSGKAPYIEQDGVLMQDSGLIIEHLERQNGHPVDGKLTLAQRAESLALQRLIEEHLFWVLVYARWVDPTPGLAPRQALQEAMGVPAGWTWLTARLARRRQTRNMHGHGMGRHAPDVIWRMGITDVQTLSHWLGNRAFAFGDAPTILDACLYATIGNIVHFPWDNPLTAAALKHRNLVDHSARMLARWFPEIPR